MSLELGGRGDKEGNRYEDRFFAKLVLELLLERYVSIEVEPLGVEGIGVEFIATTFGGERRYYQCKGSNGINKSWRPSDLENYSVFERAKKHILRNDKNSYYFISSVAYDELDALCNRARSCDGSEESFVKQLTNQSLRKWKDKCESKFQVSGSELVYILSHCYFELWPVGEENKRTLEDWIYILFIVDNFHNVESIRILLERFANDQSFWGKPICATDVSKWLEWQGIHQRNLQHDKRCLKRIEELNQIYTERFLPIESCIIHRAETEELLQHIGNGKSVIVLGVAGSGKSGCIQETIHYLKKENIPYLALSLDKAQSCSSPDQYGCSLDLPDSPVAALYRTAGKRRCVLIFDQLDALRWTNSHTSAMLDVCKSMLRQIQQFNHLEGGQISCVFAVRKFDYETDLGLQNLLACPKEKENLPFEKITVASLSEEDVKSIVGDLYSNLSSRLKELLRTPFNLYVWTKIKSEARNSVNTLFQLMDEWMNQIMIDCEKSGIDSNNVKQCFDQVISIMKHSETLFVPSRLLANQKIIEVLSSSGVLREVDKNICFCHQSFFDYYSVVDDLHLLFEGKDISSIIGGIDKQTPDIRYQLLMLLQYLSEVNCKMFLEVCRGLLETPNIRYYFRCCAIEVLGQCANPNIKYWELIADFFTQAEWHSHIIQIIFWGHPAFIRLLSEQMPEYKWQEREGRLLLGSVVQEDPELVWTILQKMKNDDLKPDELYEIVGGCVISSSPVFNLKIQLLIDNPELLKDIFSLYNLFANNYVEAIYVFKAYICLSPNLRTNIHFPDNKVLESYTSLYYQQILTTLIPVVFEIAKADSEIYHTSGWYSKRHVSDEHQIVQWMQLAINKAAENTPEEFFNCVHQWESIDSPIKQELLLHAMERLPLEYADKVFSWLLSDFDKNAFEETSMEKNELSCCQRIIQYFSPHCNANIFAQLENTLVQWRPPVEVMRADYQSMAKYRKLEGCGNYFGSFWGELQRILLPALDSTRITRSTRELIEVLKRKFPEIPSKYDISPMGMAHLITSPIDGHLDKISDKSWLKLIDSMSLRPVERNGKRWDLGIESSPPMFERSLSTAANKEPARFAALALKFPSYVYTGFADAVVQAMDSAEVSLPLACEVLRRFCKKSSNDIAFSFINVLCKRAAEDWPDDILQNLIEMANYSEDIEPDSFLVGDNKKSTNLSCDKLRQASVNCVQGYAFRAIASLLWYHSDTVGQFKVTLMNAVENENPVVLFSAMSCVAPLYNVDKEFANFLFDRLLERDLRTLAAEQAWDLLCRFYKSNIDFYADRLRMACQSPITDLRIRAVEMITVLVIMDMWTLEDIMSLSLDEQQLDTICRQVVFHFKYEESNIRCKQLLLWLIERNFKSSAFGLLFSDEYIQIERDQDFLVKVLESGCCNEVIWEVLHYLKENDIDLKVLAKLLLAVCKYLSDTHIKFLVNELLSCVVRLFNLGKDSPDILKICLDIWDDIYRSNPLAVQPFTDLLEHS